MATLRLIRTFLYDQLEASSANQKGASAFNWALIFLILFSLVLFTVETEKDFAAQYERPLWYINMSVLVIFTIEFIGRISSVGVDKRYKGATGLLSYFKSNWVMLGIDFLAFAPELIVVLLGLSPPSWLRALRIVRLFKMARYFPAFKLVIDALRSSLQELLAALTVATMVWYLSAVLIYLAENDAQPEVFGSITQSMWWSVVTLTTVGYGDAYPVTLLGKITAGFITILGVGILAIPTGILAGAFMKVISENRHSEEDS